MTDSIIAEKRSNDTEKNPLVSVIIPVYNATAYIDDCLASVTNQSYINLEIIIENDGSKDDSLIKCNAWKNKDHRITVHNHENWGVSKSRNHAMKLCNGKYIVFVDSDDIVAQTYVDVLVDMVETTKSDCAVVGVVSASDFAGNMFSDGVITVDEGICVIKSLLHKYQGYLCNKIYRKEIMREFELDLDESISVTEDLLLNVSYFEHCKSVAVYSGVQYFYRQQGRSAINRLDNIRWFDMLQVYEKIWNTYLTQQEIKSIIGFQYCMVLLEAKYRLHYIDKNYAEKYGAQIEKRLCDLRYKQFGWSFVQKMKVLAFSVAPNSVMHYRRRMLRNE